MKSRPIALVAALASLALGLFLLWRGLGSEPSGPHGTVGPEVAAEPADKAAPPGRLEAPASAEEERARTDAARTTSDLAQRTETFPLEGAAWIQGTVRFPKGSPADETLQVWAFEDSAARGLSGSENDLPDRVRTGKLEKGWWSRRPIATGDAAGAFKVPIPKGATSAAIVVDGRYLYLAKAGRVDLAKESAPLEPVLGTWIVGRCVGPPAAKPQDAPAGASVVFLALVLTPGDGDPQGGSRSTRVGPDSVFELRGVPSEHQSWLTVEPERLAGTVRSNLELLPGKRCDVEIALMLGGRASGRVVDEGGGPVAGARVELERERGDAGFFGAMGEAKNGAATGADGSFELFGIQPGKARIKARKDGFLEARTDALPFADGDVHSDLSIALSRGHHVGGRVTWPDGSPAVGAAVHAVGKAPTEDLAPEHLRFLSPDDFAPKDGKTGDRGEFSISGLGAGPFAITAVAHRAVGGPGANAEPAAGENLPAWTVELTGVAADTEDAILVLREPVGLAGRVVDDQGAPVVRFAITASPARDDAGESGYSAQIALKTTTFEAADGAFLLTGLQPGTWKLATEAKGYVQVEAPTVAVPRAEGPLVVALARAASASGTVVDPDNRPVAEAAVSRNNGERFGRFSESREENSAKTDEKGAFRIGELPPGSVQLVASAEGFARSEPVPLPIAAGQNIEGVVIRLRRGGTLTGEVFGAHGDHAVGRNVMVMSIGTQENREAKVDDAGSFVVDHLAPGAYQVIAEPTQAEQESMVSTGAGGGEVDPSEIFSALKMASAQIKEGETTHVVLGAPPKAPVRVFGTVTRAGEPVHSGTIICVGEGGSLLSKLKMGRVRESGEYEIKLDEPGAVVLSFQRELAGSGAGEFHVTIPEATEYRLDLDVPTGGLRGIVRGPDGAPLPGIPISLLKQGGLSSLSAMDQGGNETSDESGRFEFRDLAAGAYGLAAGGGGDVSGDSKNIPWGRTVVSGLRVETNRFREGIEIRLQKPCSVAGLVRDADGNPVTGATVFACDEHGEIVHRFSEVETDARGRFVYRGLAPGRYVLCARTKTVASNESAPVTVHEAGTAEVELTAGPGTTLLVSVEDKDGATLQANFSVRDAHGHDMTEMYDMGSIEGILTEGLSSTQKRIGPLPAGEYRVTATAFDGRSASKPVSLHGQSERGIKLRIE